MAGPWITDAALKQLVADTLKKSVGDLESYWDGFVAKANRAACDDITSILRGKGFTSDQLDAWDSRVTYNEDIGLYHALVKGAALNDYDQTTVDKLDRRKMLEEAGGILINGDIVVPGDTDSGAGASGGIIDDTEYRVNKVTRF